jgi:hypothetical protein
MQAHNYAAMVNGTTCITRAFSKSNAFKFFKAKDKALTAADVYEYAGVTDLGTIDEVYKEEARSWDSDERCIVYKEVEKVRLTEEYAHLA